METRYLLTFVTYVSVFCFINTFSYVNRLFADVGMLISPESMKEHLYIVDNYYSTRKSFVTSNLGGYLFKHANSRQPVSYVVKEAPKRGYYNILIWRHWKWVEQRHKTGYGSQNYDPMLGCSVSNCRFIGNDSLISTADVVVVHLQKGGLPSTKRRKPSQRWVFWADESPRHTFSLAPSNHIPTFQQMANLFNWSMTYRSDSDIPVPYGRTIPLLYPKLNDVTDEDLKDLVPNWEKKRTDVLMAIMMSHCVEWRMALITQIKRQLSVDLYGGCSKFDNMTRRCPGHYTRDCPVIAEYLFYLIAENSNCRQYISEKIFHHAYAKGAIPVIIGTPLEDCIKLLPPNSFIHLGNYVSIIHMAKEIYAIGNDVTKLLSYHAWRNHFQAVEEHGFLGTRSLALCRICEAINYNDGNVKIYNLDDIRLYLDPVVSCFRNMFWRPGDPPE